MGKLRYLARIASGLRVKKLRDVLDRTQEKCGKNRVFLLLDMLWCAARYGCGFHDYLIFGWYDMNARQRATYITRVSNKRINELCNDPAYSHLFDRKCEFNKLFKEFLGRETVDLAETDRETFRAFMADKEVIFCKPNSSESGKGIERLVKSDFASVDELYDYVMQPEKNFGVAEQEIIQHPDAARPYPPAVNTLRINTLARNGEVHIPFCTFKMGNLGKHVDNMENDGLACPVDMETGKICGVAHTSKLVNYDAHPYTGVPLLGYQLPFIPEALDLVKKAALVVPQIGHVGWDVCLTPDGPAIIEGNDFPGYDFSQLPEHTPDKIGNLPFYKKYIPEL